MGDLEIVLLSLHTRWGRCQCSRIKVNEMKTRLKLHEWNGWPGWQWGWRSLSQFSRFSYFPSFSIVSIYRQPVCVEFNVHIWQVLPQHSCGNSCQIWTSNSKDLTDIFSKPKISLMEKLTDTALVIPILAVLMLRALFRYEYNLFSDTAIPIERTRLSSYLCNVNSYTGETGL